MIDAAGVSGGADRSGAGARLDTGQSGKSAKPCAAVAGRGGLLPPMECGAYLVDDAMVEALRGHGAENTRRTWARCWRLRFAAGAGVRAYIVDPVTVDEWQPCARLTGSPLVERI